MAKDQFGNYLCDMNSAAVLVDPSSGGGGGGGIAGDYAGGKPNVSGTDGESAVDTGTGRVWWYYRGDWN